MGIDTVSDMLTRIRNASLAQRAIVEIPATKLTIKIGEVLLKEGFIAGLNRIPTSKKKSLSKTEKKLNVLALKLKYRGENGDVPVIKDIVRVSRPGRRVYHSVKKLSKIQNGFTCALISTSGGLLTDREAVERWVGGEVLCYIS